MEEEYYEILIIPSSLGDIFSDFIIDLTSQAIEEIDFFHTNTLDSSFHLYHFVHLPAISQAIIVRLQKHDSISPDILVENLKAFSDTLSERTLNQIGFGYKILKKQNLDWIKQYQNSIEPLECGRFYIHPSWHKARDGAENIIIDPALAFGSGHHASTFMCIEFLQNIDLSGKYALDVGCGSGILSIIMAKNGAIVESCDVDELAVQETLKNATLNNVKIQNIWEGSINKASHQYDIIVANIVADVIIYLYDDCKKLLKNGGILILSGILENKAQRIIEVFHDFHLQEQRHKDEWVSLKFILI